VILLDTHVLIYDALAPERLSTAARAALDDGEADGSLACCDISLWEVAMLAAKGRVAFGTDTATFLRNALAARGIRVLAITPEVAALSQSGTVPAGDPADRLIAATAVHHGATLVTRDEALHALAGLSTLL
jgi:PIN domain nuclease of toxin-antitoxin system